MQAHIMSLNTPSPMGLGQKVKLFSECDYAAYQIKGREV